MAKTATVEIDEKGRVHIPAEVRRELKTRRFSLSLSEGRILMEPVKSPRLVRGKYKHLVKIADIEELEEAQEQFVNAGQRGLSIKDALREAAQRWTQEESGIDPADSFFDIALGRRNPQDWGKGSESDSRELDRLIYSGQSAKKKRSKK